MEDMKNALNDELLEDVTGGAEQSENGVHYFNGGKLIAYERCPRCQCIEVESDCNNYYGPHVRDTKCAGCGLNYVQYCDY